MRIHRSALATVAVGVAVAAAVLSFSACAKDNGNIVVQLINAPATLTVNQSVSLTANVNNDSSNAGVDWTCTTAGQCGSFAPTHTESGQTTIYTAPATEGTVTIIATSTADSTVQASVTISIVPTGTNAMLNGTYVFSVQGSDTNGSYIAAGTIVADGNGNITGGLQDYSDVATQAGPDAVTGTYSIGPTGRGSITLNVGNTSLPNNGVETFGIALVSATHGLIIQFDGSATSSGTIDAQIATALDAASFDGAYAFTIQGTDTGNQVPYSAGGVLLMNASTGTITSGTYDENDGGTTFSGALTGSVTGPDGSGRGTITFSVGPHFAYYAVRGNVLRLVGKDVGTVLAGGAMYGQGAAGVGATFSNASLTGKFVFTEAGGTLHGPLALAGQFTSDGAGNLTAGVADVNNGGTTTFGSVVGTAAYSIAGDGAGSLTLPAAIDTNGSVSALKIFAVAPALNLLDPSNPGGGGGALILDFDSGANGTGVIVPQTASAYEGDYAVNLQYVDADGEHDWVGTVTAAGAALTGKVDINDIGLTTAAVTFTGTLGADTTYMGRWTGSFTAGGTTHAIKYYQVDGSAFLFVDTDSLDVGIGILQRE